MGMTYAERIAKRCEEYCHVCSSWGGIYKTPYDPRLPHHTLYQRTFNRNSLQHTTYTKQQRHVQQAQEQAQQSATSISSQHREQYELDPRDSNNQRTPKVNKQHNSIITLPLTLGKHVKHTRQRSAFSNHNRINISKPQSGTCSKHHKEQHSVRQIIITRSQATTRHLLERQLME